MNNPERFRHICLVVASTAAIVACSDPLPIAKKGDAADSHPTVASDVTRASPLPDHGVSRVWVDHTGKVIGIVFSTPEGDVCERIDASTSITHGFSDLTIPGPGDVSEFR